VTLHSRGPHRERNRIPQVFRLSPLPICTLSMRQTSNQRFLNKQCLIFVTHHIEVGSKSDFGCNVLFTASYSLHHNLHFDISLMSVSLLVLRYSHSANQQILPFFGN
jgi:hypothetical protein